jgi:hypothetical protein
MSAELLGSRALNHAMGLGELLESIGAWQRRGRDSNPRGSY